MLSLGTEQMKRRIQRIVIENQTLHWSVKRPAGLSGEHFVILRVWSDTSRPLEVRIRCDDLWVNYPHLLIAPQRTQEVLEFRIVTPSVVRQVLEDLAALGRTETEDRSPLRFDWDRDAKIGLRLQPWSSLPDFKSS